MGLEQDTGDELLRSDGCPYHQAAMRRSCSFLFIELSLVMVDTMLNL